MAKKSTPRKRRRPDHAANYEKYYEAARTPEAKQKRADRHERNYYLTDTRTSPQNAPRVLAAHWLNAIITDNGNLPAKHSAHHDNARTWLVRASKARRPQPQA